MRKLRLWASLPLLILAIIWSYYSLMPSNSNSVVEETYGFSTDSALHHVKNISKTPHGVGFPAHAKVREYIVKTLESMGLEVSIQEGFTGGDWANFSKVKNIVARIKGSGNGKSLLLLSHYDSSPHSSLGASDAGSGVATVLEGIRAFMAQKKVFDNDIIILISDAEEQGLNGADVFANQHPWTKDVGLILNFEARGSGGPSYLFMETNRGNEKLVSEFIKAQPKYPVANSLAYSIYKLLPNDTDLTVFREDRDIEGFNFAFIDDHFDYHTVRDSYERLDRNSVTHQGSYLMPLLLHFSETNLNDLKSLNDNIYINMPGFGMVTYPYDWIWPMWILALIFWLICLGLGIKNKSLQILQVLKGFIPMLLTLGINLLVGYYFWNIITKIYPEYRNILHGFTYNGHSYILAMALFSVGVCFLVYRQFRKIALPNLLIAPALLWLVICWGVATYLQGASFFILPVFALLTSLLILIYQKEPDPLLLLFLALPAIFIFSPFIAMFPIALGLKMLVTSTLFTCLTFLLILPLVSRYSQMKNLGVILMVGFMIAMITAHINSGFSEDNANPTSLVYIMNTDDKTAQYATYEQRPSEWTKLAIGSNMTEYKLKDKTLGSKYSSRFTFVGKAPLKEISGPVVTIEKDTVIDGERILEMGIFPQRNVNRLEVFTNTENIKSAKINGVALSDRYLKTRRNQRLFTHYISDNDSTMLQVVMPKGKELNLTLYEASNDLLTNPQFTIKPRTSDLIPAPFVLNDAVITIKNIRH